jgi:hypothetical protein
MFMGTIRSDAMMAGVAEGAAISSEIRMCCQGGHLQFLF